jgi:hypothetical protein
VRRSRLVFSLLAAVCASTVLVHAPAADAAPGPRVHLRVLLVSDGGPATQAIAQELAAEGVPYTKVDLTASSRPAITPAFLSRTVNGISEALFQAVVLPNENPFGAGSAEMAALVAYEQKFKIRQVDAFTYPTPAVGLNYPADPGYVGALDGTAAKATPDATAGPLRYLTGPVPFEDNAPQVTEAYGYLSTPLPDDAAAGRSFVPYLTATIPGTSTQGVLAGVYTAGGRSEWVTTFAYNFHQHQYRLIAHGMVTWMTRGVHLGHNRNYLSVHVDDVFLPNARWNSTENCTPTSGCPASVPEGAPIRMTAADVDFAKQWQAANGFAFDLYFNGGGSDRHTAAHGSDPLLTALQRDRASFRFANHTFEHPYLGCVQDLTVVPWRCATTATGAVRYVPRATITDQISRNTTWARNKGLPVQADELVTGEHSGLFLLPQQPQDNPNLAPALTDTNITWLGSDHSRDPAQRSVGSALTVPRHPMNIFYNVATAAEEVDEYNWIYTSRADGGSGTCERDPGTVTCMEPLDTETGYAGHIVPTEARIALGHVLANDPAPHYVHQSNLTEGRIVYPVLEKLLGRYRQEFAANSPIVNLRLRDTGAQVRRQALWEKAAGGVTAYVQDGVVTVKGPSGTQVPVTAPEGTRHGGLLGGTFGTAYAGERSAFLPTGLTASTLVLPAGTAA